jgi:hypothetical protein
MYRTGLMDLSTPACMRLHPVLCCTQNEKIGPGAAVESFIEDWEELIPEDGGVVILWRSAKLLPAWVFEYWAGLKKNL